jgi:hypothetical protein
MRRLFGVAVLSGVAILVLSATAQAAVETNISVPIAGLQPAQFIPCANGGAGEYVDFTGGNLHILLTYTQTANTVSGKFQFQPEGVTAVGETTGDTYQGTGVTQGTFTATFVKGAATSTFVNNFRIIGPGPGNNYLEFEVAHVTFNANGTVTADFDRLSVSCK